MKSLYNNVCKNWFGGMMLACLTLFVALFTFSSCDGDNTSDLQLSGDCSVEAIQLDNFEGIIDLASRSITVRVPEMYNTSNMKVTSLQLSEGAESNILLGQALNMDASQNIHVTNGDLYLDWTLTVRRDEAKIYSFTINSLYPGIINQDNKTITAYIPKSEDIKAIIPVIEYSEDATCSPINGAPQDFSAPVTYTITNGTAKSEYVVTINQIDKPAALFVGAASNLSELDSEAYMACLWMLANVPNSLYASFADIKAEAIDLSECKIIWWHYHQDGGVDGHDAFIAKAPEAIEATNQLRNFYENGGSFFLTRYATNLPSFIGATGNDEWTTPNNCWGGNEDGAELCGGPWDFVKFDASHPLFSGIVEGDDSNRVYCTDAGYHITNSTAQYHIGTDWGDYKTDADWLNRTGAKIIGKGGDGAIVAWEYPAQAGKGGIICIGSGCYDWYTYTVESGYNEKFHKNIEIMTKNAFDYLTK